MKKCIIAVMLGLLLCPVSANAADFFARGLWDFGFQLGHGGSLYDTYGYGGNTRNPGRDDFAATQRLRTFVGFRASENLSGTLMLKISSTLYDNWGDASHGAALGTDGVEVAVKMAFLDWTVPNSKLKLRMGLQYVAFPSFTGQTTILDNCVAGITANYRVNDNFGITALWLRPFNDNYVDPKSNIGGYLDNIDVFGLFLPITGDGFKVTPWVAYGMVGKNARWAGMGKGNAATATFVHNFYRGRDMGEADNMYDYGSTFMGGITGEITALDPFRFAWEASYAGSWSGEEKYDRRGWTASLLAEYKLDWGTPGIYGWYASGEDSSAKNGSERILQFSQFPGKNDFAAVAFNGHQNQINRGGMLGMTFAGTWGIGARLKDVSFVEGWKLTPRVVYIHGTNEKKGMAHVYTFRHNPVGPDFMVNNVFNHVGDVLLSKNESAVEFSVSSEYKIYDNLKLYTDIGYLATNRSRYAFRDAGKSQCDGWNASLIFEYGF